MHRPDNEPVASLVGVETILRGEVIRRSQGTFIASVSGREIEAVGERNKGERVLLCIRAENVTLSTVGSGNTAREINTFPAKVEKIVPLWLYRKVFLDCGFPLVAYVLDHDLNSVHLEKGMEVKATIRAIHVIGENNGK
jgi:tungstate transport system ATP-binding protein